ncbi:MAG: hypothetical protein KDI61_07060, partial [Alphaproteobacteria bacterium]|nr:hypothetical protein [Alphaproteobacteria bacterium]
RRVVISGHFFDPAGIHSGANMTLRTKAKTCSAEPRAATGFAFLNRSILFLNLPAHYFSGNIALVP